MKPGRDERRGWLLAASVLAALTIAPRSWAQAEPPDEPPAGDRPADGDKPRFDSKGRQIDKPDA